MPKSTARPSVAQQVANRDFARKTISALRKQGVEVVGSSLADVYGMSRSYRLVKDDTFFIRSFAEVREIAAGTLVLEVQ